LEISQIQQSNIENEISKIPLLENITKNINEKIEKIKTKQINELSQELTKLKTIFSANKNNLFENASECYNYLIVENNNMKKIIEKSYLKNNLNKNKNKNKNKNENKNKNKIYKKLKIIKIKK